MKKIIAERIKELEKRSGIVKDLVVLSQEKLIKNNKTIIKTYEIIDGKKILLPNGISDLKKYGNIEDLNILIDDIGIF